MAFAALASRGWVTTARVGTRLQSPPQVTKSQVKRYADAYWGRELDVKAGHATHKYVPNPGLEKWNAPYIRGRVNGQVIQHLSPFEVEVVGPFFHGIHTRAWAKISETAVFTVPLVASYWAIKNFAISAQTQVYYNDRP